MKAFFLEQKKLNQLQTIGFYQFDGALRYTRADGQEILALMNYNSSFAHGCIETCSSPQHQFDDKKRSSVETETRVRRFLDALASSLNLSIDLTIVADCPDHFSKKAKEPEDQILGGKRVMTYKGTKDTAMSLSNFFDP